MLRRKTTAKAKSILQEVIMKTNPVPFKRFSGDIGHKKGISAGRYPVKTAKEVLKLIQLAEANAQFKGLNTGNLTINHIAATKASRPWHYGRQRRRKMKRTNIEIMVEEVQKIKEQTKTGSVKKAHETKKDDKNTDKVTKEIRKTQPSKKDANEKISEKKKAEDAQ
jgi:large subunit ribosomal protein L22